MQVRSLGQEDPLEEEMATQSCALAWENLMDRGTQWAIGVTESDTNEHTRTHFFLNGPQTFP